MHFIDNRFPFQGIAVVFFFASSSKNVRCLQGVGIGLIQGFDRVQIGTVK